MDATYQRPSGSHASESEASSSEIEDVTIDTILRDFMSRVSTFLHAPIDLPMWQPPKTWTPFRERDPEDIRRAGALSMPTIRPTSQTPDMLLCALGGMHILDPDYPSRLEDFLSGDQHIYLCNASGTGKTRLLFESLSQKWGIYLTCYHDHRSDPYGSGDLHQALSGLNWDSATRRLLCDIPLRGPGSRHASVALDLNRRRAANVLRRVLLARLLVFDHFIAAVDQLGIPDDVARRKWFILQVRPDVTSGRDIFLDLWDLISNLSDLEVLDRISALRVTNRTKLAFVAVDEAQVALKMNPRAFVVYSHVRRHAAALREIVFGLADEFPAARIIVSGTQLDMDVMRDAIAASRAIVKGVRHFYNLGAFRTERRVHDYISHFLGPSTADEVALLIYQWLRGRHRLLANLVTYTLMTGVARVINVLDTFIHQMTGFVRSDAARRGIMHIGRIFDHAWLENFAFSHLLRQALLSFIRTSAPSSFTAHAGDLVSVGAALFCGPEPHAKIFEPLIFLALSFWLQTSSRFSATAIVRRCMAGDDPRNDEIHDAYVLEAVASCMQRLATLPDFRLKGHLRFSGPEPSWARERATLVLPRIRGERLEFDPLSTTRLSSPLVAHDSNDVHEWFRSASHAFLLPDSKFGASIICFFQLEESGTVFAACFHLPSVRSSRRDKRFVPCDPAHFYRTLRSSAAWLQALLAQLPTLPLPSDRSSRHGLESPTRHARFSVLHILCFVDAFSDEPHDPPISSLMLSEMALRTLPDEVQFDDVVAAV
ncbi:hypothetical protein EXIGLDRAFT_830425 [Exidia glandulosa HHB12029]|uniref:Uncharacterized protein n=1 Tax=Exidia glandulosa HHB12029 TaxID=1314781 RepID=A0A165NP45_EXIGL|nr:hypothetical protein EXIGLDRAFT_830425 [Exidia glandulosa HHB12029]